MKATATTTTPPIAGAVRRRRTKPAEVAVAAFGAAKGEDAVGGAAQEDGVEVVVVDGEWLRRLRPTGAAATGRGTQTIRTSSTLVERK